ncbi:MAG TPA: DNA repair protein RecN [Lachnospiraceae bacterium]|nr:DNA repair protein RecN [Lachnospiraceae bacterium]
MAMLLGLHIKNVALIEEEEIEFGKGFNVLSGETGAGKSMIIDAINFVLGERTSKDFVRRGQAKAQVEAEFEIKDRDTLSAIQEIGIEADDNIVIIQRIMTAEGKSTNRVNGTSVTAGMLKQISEGLIDVHGQHEHQSLLNAARHMDILDKFCGEKIEQYKADLGVLIKEYKSILLQINALAGDDEERSKKIEALEFKINDIEDASLKKGEEEALLERKGYLNNIEKITKYTHNAMELLYLGADEEMSASDKIAQAIDDVGNLKVIDPDCSKIYDELNEVGTALDDVIRKFKKYSDEIFSSPEELDNIEERLDIIYRLKKKYGATVEEVLAFQERLQEELNFISNSEEELKKLSLRKADIFSKIKVDCKKMTDLRIKTAQQLEQEIETQLKELEMKNASFKIVVKQKDTFNSKGCDNVEFMISANLGEELKPLAKIASGGEMSRVMLAMKTVVAHAEPIDTFIFDEIDTGVSGKTAVRVGEKMATIGKKRQILCITHLPQIAAMADRHFLIEKSVKGEKTVTEVKALDYNGAVGEISRLMGGGQAGNLVTKAAEEMKKYADEYKSSIKVK